MVKQRSWLLIGALLAVLVVLTTIFATHKYEKPAEWREQHQVFAMHIPNKLDFAGERVPLEFFDVKEGLDRELHVNTYWQSQTIFLIKRANRFFPEIEAILKEEGVPIDFKYLAVAESGLTNAVSPANAVGFWQLLKNTGKELGLQVDSEVDERFNLEKSTRAACKYLKKSFNKHGNWTIAAAAYNMGGNGILKQMEYQKEQDYYNLALNEETSRYLFRILAIKLIIESPESYGFYIDKKDLYVPLQYTTLKVNTSIADLTDFAKKNNTNYKLLRLFNPWLRDNSLTNKNSNNYYIRIPANGFREALYADTNDTLPLVSKIKDTLSIESGTKQ
jgi:membrane-bound lytic murein transglycosylase D